MAIHVSGTFIFVSYIVAFIEGGLTNENVKDLCFESMKEIIPEEGMKGILLRSRIWKVISQVKCLHKHTITVEGCTVVVGRFNAFRYRLPPFFYFV